MIRQASCHGGKALCILDFGTRWCWVVSFMLCHILPLGKEPLVPIGYEAAWVLESVSQNWWWWWREVPASAKNLNPNHPASNQSLNWFSYSNSILMSRHAGLEIDKALTRPSHITWQVLWLSEDEYQLKCVYWNKWQVTPFLTRSKWRN
jgi:hypothetical protein